MFSFYKDMFFFEVCYLIGFLLTYWLFGFPNNFNLFFIFDLSIYLIFVNICYFFDFEFCYFKKE